MLRYAAGMAGTRKDVRARLLRAALDLFSERGFDATTAADIAARADVTERTYFRHFPDKREALFDGEDELRQKFASAVAQVQVGGAPMAILLAAFRSLIPALASDRDLKRRRQVVIAAAPELRERELTKEHHLAAAVARALQERGVREPVASLAALSGIAALSRVRLEWLREGGDYAARLTEAFADLESAFAPWNNWSRSSPGPM